MPPAPRSREITALPGIAVLGFGMPIARAGSLILPVHVHGDMHRLHAIASLWKKAALDILRIVAPEELVENQNPETMPAMAALCESALGLVRAGSSPSDAAKSLGIEPAAFRRWLQSATTYDPSREPITKPSGQIL